MRSHPHPWRDAQSTWVYFIQEDRTGSIKIGTSSHPHSRLKQIQTASGAGALRLLGGIRHESRMRAFDTERRIHGLLSKHRVSGEWFLPHPDVLALIPTEPIAAPQPRARVAHAQQ